MTMRNVTPGASAPTTLKVNGRTYTAAVGSFLSVPDFDAQQLESNGWIGIDSGTTAQRPVAPGRGQSFMDTTLGYVIHFDGKVWRNLASGAAV